MSLRWTPDQATEYMSRFKKKPVNRELEDQPDPGPESKLQAKCMKYCKEHGFPVFHDWSKKRNQPGWPDLFVFIKGRVVLVELKAESGKLRKEQKHLRQVLNWLSHTVYVCRSYAGFVRIMTEETEIIVEAINDK